MQSQVYVGLTLIVAIMGGSGATDQICDSVKYDGKDLWMEECPLGWFWSEKNPGPEFDMVSTANWKGYEAGWEVKDSKLRLVSFSARMNGKPISIDAIMPGKTLPMTAEWFTGKIQIPIGKPDHHFMRSGTYPTIVILEVDKGVIKKTTEKKNAKIDFEINTPKEKQPSKPDKQSPLTPKKK